ncbi:I78 family peptidase inhibitor [Streptomyces sp. NPDC050504]|uniref:I78 family peptidase inhibitor n=1 Tax=Streptomyces sp. NPDC050504 TaxID=3365618 RepID=UPI003794F78A
MMRSRVALAALALAACGALTTTVPAVAAEEPTQCACEAEAAKYQALRGEPYADHPSSYAPKRVYHVGDMLTTDLVHDRLNIALDDHDRIERASCG